MNSKRIVTTLAATGLLGAFAFSPLALAGDQAKPTMEQRGEQAQTAVRDAWLQGKLETALLFNEHLNSFAIDTEVKHGVAYLSGAVESDIDRDLAHEIAQSVNGISKVENSLVVDMKRSAMTHDDGDSNSDKTFRESVLNATMTARVKTQLLANNNVSGLEIDVDSREGSVTLSGTVGSEQQKELAERIAANTNGVDAVSNQLTVNAVEDAE